MRNSIKEKEFYYVITNMMSDAQFVKIQEAVRLLQMPAKYLHMVLESQTLLHFKIICDAIKNTKISHQLSIAILPNIGVSEAKLLATALAKTMVPSLEIRLAGNENDKNLVLNILGDSVKKINSFLKLFWNEHHIKSGIPKYFLSDEINYPKYWNEAAEGNIALMDNKEQLVRAYGIYNENINQIFSRLVDISEIKWLNEDVKSIIFSYLDIYHSHDSERLPALFVWINKAIHNKEIIVNNKYWTFEYWKFGLTVKNNHNHNSFIREAPLDSSHWMKWLDVFKTKKQKMLQFAKLNIKAEYMKNIYQDVFNKNQEETYSSLMKIIHPSNGGSDKACKELNAIYEAKDVIVKIREINLVLRGLNLLFDIEASYINWNSGDSVNNKDVLHLFVDFTSYIGMYTHSPYTILSAKIIEIGYNIYEKDYLQVATDTIFTVIMMTSYGALMEYAPEGTLIASNIMFTTLNFLALNQNIYNSWHEITADDLEKEVCDITCYSQYIFNLWEEYF